MEQDKLGFVYAQAFEDAAEFARAETFDTRQGVFWVATRSNFRIKRRMLARMRCAGLRYQLALDEEQAGKIPVAAAILDETNRKLEPFSLLEIEGIEDWPQDACEPKWLVPSRHYLMFSTNEDRLLFRLLMEGSGA